MAEVYPIAQKWNITVWSVERKSSKETISEPELTNLIILIIYLFICLSIMFVCFC